MDNIKEKPTSPKGPANDSDVVVKIKVLRLCI